MIQFLLVALGGAIGSAARYGVGLAAVRLFGLGFPWGTLIINVVGGVAMGVLAARLGAELNPGQDNLRLLLGVGVLGGFTTFSAFSLETVRLMEQGAAPAVLYVTASLVLSVAGCWAGFALGR